MKEKIAEDKGRNKADKRKMDQVSEVSRQILGWGARWAP